MGFNKAQKQAIAHYKGPCMVLSGPGSGKTTVITNRIAELIQNYKVKPEEILVVTFSKSATNEMRERFLKLWGEGSCAVTFGTFHGIYYGILKWAYQLTADHIFSDEQKFALLRQVTERLNISVSDEKEALEGIASEISTIKNNHITLSEYQPVVCEKEDFLKIYQAYEKERKELQKLDFDDMLVLTCELFQKRPDLLKQWQRKYKYILIDEFQDINTVQYEVICMLARPENNLFIVGDDDQSIYGFRGARPDMMKLFLQEFPEAKTILLGVNYRSTKAIVNASVRVIEHNENRFLKKIVAENGQGVQVHVQEVRHPIEESEYIVREIMHTIERGVEPSDIAVLFRTNQEARTLAETCMEYNIAYSMKERLSNLYEHFIARNLIAYMKIALGDHSRRLFLEIINRPNRYIARSSIEGEEVSFQELREIYRSREWMLERLIQLEDDLAVIKQCAPYAAIQYIRKRIGYDAFLKEYAQKHRINEEELLEILKAIEERAKGYRTIREWLVHIQEYTAKLHEQNKSQQMNEGSILLMTMHAAKGLEFHTVFLIGANEDICPYKKAKTKEEIEEERRLFYVAMTRAKKRLVISYVKERQGKNMSPSRFVEEVLNIKKV